MGRRNSFFQRVNFDFAGTVLKLEMISPSPHIDGTLNKQSVFFKNAIKDTIVHIKKKY